MLAAWMALNVLAEDKYSQSLSLVRVTSASPSPLYPRAGPPSR
jgi:hypothetical protein